MDTTPVTLLERLRTPGGDDAWCELAALVTPLLLVWGRRIGLSRDDADDLAQDMLTVLVDKLRSFDYDSARSFRAWLKTIAMNKWRQRQRKSARITSKARDELEAIFLFPGQLGVGRGELVELAGGVERAVGRPRWRSAWRRRTAAA